MAIAHQFEYHRPGSLERAVALMAEHKGRAMVLAGGTDLVNWLKEDFVHPDAVIDIKRVHGFDRLEVRDGRLMVGPCVTFRDLIDHAGVREMMPLIVEQSGVVGCHGVRNRATMVGNICSGVPCCDSGPVLQVYEAEVLVRGPEGERRIPIRDWFVGPKKTARRDAEIVTGIEIPRPAGRHAGIYVKLGRYQGEDLAQVSVAIVALEGGEFRISFGAVAPTPVRAPKIEAAVRGRKLETVAELASLDALVEEAIAPISDVRATREYRLHMAKVMVKRGLVAAQQRLAGKGPALGDKLI